jgi:RNA polymerase sigma factor (sigma-70 family)
VSRDLVLRAQAGDADAFSALVEPRLDRLYGAAALIVRRADLAQDAVQEALVSAWRDLRALRDPDRFDAWVHRLLVRACYRVLRKQRINDVRELTLIGVDAASTMDIARAVAEGDLLERAMRRLSVDHRAVIVARYHLGLDLAECAGVLNLPLGTVQSRLSRATALMRAAVDADDRAGSAPAEVPA